MKAISPIVIVDFSLKVAGSGGYEKDSAEQESGPATSFRGLKDFNGHIKIHQSNNELVP